MLMRHTGPRIRIELSSLTFLAGSSKPFVMTTISATTKLIDEVWDGVSTTSEDPNLERIFDGSLGEMNIFEVVVHQQDLLDEEK